MTQEEKLLKLLQIAVENGWKSPLKTPFEKCEIKPMKNVVLSYEINPAFENDEMWVYVHLNDLVTNFEEGEVSFIEALVQADPISAVNHTYNFEIIASSDFTRLLNYNWKHNGFTSLRLIWVMLPTSQRLAWLFKTFKHLL